MPWYNGRVASSKDSRGVLHRDLKPGNVMLGKYGETLVVDWGLAKPLGHREAGAESDERTLKPASASGSAPTQMGSAIGTPQYMSPEQAEGRLDSLGPATDIYSLGGTLYCLLAGRTPFAEGDAGTILGHVSKGDFPPPRSIKKDVPPALQAICLKAMALRPADRYPSARALADDVEHWLADEPMAAHHEVFVERAGRWLRRHRAAARAAAVVLLSLSVVSSLAAVLINAARGEAQRQRDIAREAQRAEAAQVVETRKALAAETAAKDAETAAKNAETAAKNEAKAAIDRYVETVQESELLKEERFQPLRKKLLSDALDYYQSFIEAHQHDSTMRRDLATALFDVGRISADSGSMADALAAYQRALAIQEGLAEKDPTVQVHQSRLAKCYNNLGNLQGETGDPGAALISYQRALAVQAKLAADNPTVVEYRRDLANHYNNIGILQIKTGEWDEALASHQCALAIREKLAAEHVSVTTYQSDLAKCYNTLGNVERTLNDREAALASFHHALAILKKLAVENPTDVEYHRNLGNSYSNLGLLQAETGDRNAALASFRQALEIREKLAAEDPTVTEHRRDLADNYNNLGLLQAASGDGKAALSSYRRALAIFEKLAVENPSATECQSFLASSYNNLSALHGV
ncbi:MAG TPA: tetratricopeptide repeat protein, partial [Pirellulales bacterium]|nr:tetratricopeptide repeat protein [Pirellulales bacterium]